MKQYQIIYADPPWKQSKGGKKSVRPTSSGSPLVYPVISIEEIKTHLQHFVGLTDSNSVLFLWTIDKYLHEAEVMAKELGYKLHARMVWNKVTGIPAAFTVRYGHEYLLFMYKGKLIPVAKAERGKIHTVFTEQVKRHSEKPEIAYQIIERLYPNAEKMELYARKERIGWDSWGNEIKAGALHYILQQAKGRLTCFPGSRKPEYRLRPSADRCLQLACKERRIVRLKGKDENN